MMFLGSVILLVHLLGVFAADKFTAVIETSSGPVQGKIFTTLNSIEYASFKGIRYAKPPIGELRFKAPEAVVPKEETRSAFRYGKNCRQANWSGYIGSEDCLFLNVFTPVTSLSETPTELKPVMVWFHEGNFARRSGDMSLKKPDLILERGVVFVSLNYRLGAFGFLSLDEPGMTGNQGLKDQVLALKWVQTNIAKFGGNPKKVTIFGKGAGAVSVGLHVLSKASAGLFHGAISMSGTPLAPQSFISREEAARRGKRLAEMAGGGKLFLSPHGNKSYRQALRWAVPLRIMKKILRVDPVIPFLPTIEDPSKATDVFLSEDLRAIYESGNFNKVPHILGSTFSDTILYSDFINETINANKESFDKEVDVHSVKAAISRCFERGGIVSGFRIGAERYRTITSSAEPDDKMYFCDPVSETLGLLVKKNGNNPVYHYKMSFQAYADSISRLFIHKTPVHIYNYAYAEDLKTIFHNSSGGYFARYPSGMDLITDRVVTWWTNFAKYGDPTPDRQNNDLEYFKWPTADSFGPTLQIDTALTTKSKPTVEWISMLDHKTIGPLYFFFYSNVYEQKDEMNKDPDITETVSFNVFIH